jgi:hypothetical protein
MFKVLFYLGDEIGNYSDRTRFVAIMMSYVPRKGEVVYLLYSDLETLGMDIEEISNPQDYIKVGKVLYSMNEDYKAQVYVELVPY